MGTPLVEYSSKGEEDKPLVIECLFLRFTKICFQHSSLEGELLWEGKRITGTLGECLSGRGCESIS